MPLLRNQLHRPQVALDIRNREIEPAPVGGEFPPQRASAAVAISNTKPLGLADSYAVEGAVFAANRARPEWNGRSAL
jgi:hypothetical protein